MKRAVCAFLGAALSVLGESASADTLAMLVPAPLPPQNSEKAFEHLLQVYPDKRPVSITSLAPSRDRVRSQADISAFGIACQPSLTTRVLPDARIGITLSAPCKPNETVSVTLDSLKLDLMLSVTGSYDFSLPALKNSTKIESVFEDGSRISSVVEVPSLEEYVRVAIIWQNPHGATLTAQAPRYLPVKIDRFEDAAGRMVQILSHHITGPHRSGVIRLGVRAEITDQNCKKTREAEIHQISPGLPLLTYAMSISPTECGRVGDTLQLKNILQDLKLAAQ